MGGRADAAEAWIVVTKDPRESLIHLGLRSIVEFPPVCLPHGEPAVEYGKSEHSLSYSALSDDLPENTIGNFFFRSRAPKGSVRYRPRGAFVPDAKLHCEWPLCTTCLRRYRPLRVARLASFAIAFATFAVLLVVVFLVPEPSEMMVMSAFFAFAPGSVIPMTCAVGFGRLAANVGKIRVTHDHRWAVVPAHPAFVAALDVVYDRYVADQ